MKRNKHKIHEFLMFTTPPPDLDFIDSPWLSELEQACILKGHPECFCKHLQAENIVWAQMDRLLRYLDSLKDFDLGMREEYETVDFKREALKREVSVPYQSKIHAMRIELMAEMQEQRLSC